jgi:dipeptidyl aminopeptidase/acylaminoacyl peptidase
MKPASLICALLLGHSFVAAAQAPPLEAFASLPAMESPSISPDGKRLAFIAQADAGSYVMVSDLATMAVGAAVDVSAMKPRRLSWTNDDTLLLLASETITVRYVARQAESMAPYGIDLSGDLTIRQLLLAGRRERGSVIGGATNVIGGYIFVQGAQVIGYRRSTGDVLMGKFASNADRVLYAVDAKTDQLSQVDGGNPYTQDWIVDENGEPKFRLEYRQEYDTLSIMRRAETGWEMISRQTIAIPEMGLAGLDGEGRLIVIQRGSDNGGRFGLYVMSAENGAIERPLYTHATLDVAGARVDPYTNRVVGADVGPDEVVWFDSELRAQQAELDQAFRGESPRIVSWSQDRTRSIVSTEGEDRAAAYYLLDSKAGTAKQIAATNMQLAGVKLARRAAYGYAARDGVQIPSYLTRPLGVEGPAPLVLLPHGGPAARDFGGYDWLAHGLASRGYAVLQPNFRGSGGFGQQWEEAGHGEWGIGVMQHDLTDGVAAVVAAGIADPDRVCIVGASYGGYAALAGAAFTPELYRCAAAIAGVADLRDMLNYERERAGDRSSTVSYWRQAMGVDEEGSSRQDLDAASPAQHAERVRAAVLLIHGRDDTVVPIVQSRTMERALQGAGKSVQFVELEGEDHWLSGSKTRLETLKALDVFLTEQLAN